jgi:hypothetical protein
MKRLSSILLALAATTALAQTTPITVANYNFSDQAPPFPTGCGVTCTYQFSAITDWNSTGNSGVWAPDASEFTGYNGTTTMAFSNGGTISQTVTATVVAGDTYTLTVDIGNRADGSYFGDPGANLLIGGTQYFYAAGTEPASGAFSAYTATFFATPSMNDDTITIDLTTGWVQGDFSDVTLTQTVPEGGANSLYLLLAGLCCFGAIFLSSRKPLASRI